MERKRMKPTPAITRAPRRRLGRRRIRLRVIFALILLLAAACIGISGFVGWQLSHPNPKPLEDSPKRLGMAYEDVQFQSRQGDLLLKGWYMPPAQTVESATYGKAQIIMAHGYKNNREQKNAEALSLAKDLTDRGFGVLMFDFRNSGESEGTMTSVGYYEKYDLLGAIDWIKAQRPGKIGVLGFSMGASTALTAAAEEPAVAGIVADSPFNRLSSYLNDNLSVWSHLPDFPFTPLIMNMLPPMLGIEPDEVDGLRAVDAIYPRPVLFIHSANDPSIPLRNSESLWEKHKDRFELWTTAAEGHARNYPPQKQEYADRVSAFFEQL